MWVPPLMLNSVGFLMYKDMEAPLPNRFAGTAFFIVVEPGEGLEPIPYTVTAKHVVVEAARRATDGQVWLRVNSSDGGVVSAPTSPEDWISLDDGSADIAVFEGIPDGLMQHTEPEVIGIPLDMFITDELAESHEISIGDDLFFAGLFAPHNQSVSRNVPILRVGNIASLRGERVHTRHYGPIDAYLAEARSIGGLSGSPVFVSIAGVRRNMIVGGSDYRFYLLGIMHGHWERHGGLAEQDDADGDEREKVNMGIAIVTPAQRLAALLDQPTLRENRARAIEARKELSQEPGGATGSPEP